MNSEMKEGENREISIEPEDLKPKRPSNRAPEGIRTFTVCRIWRWCGNRGSQLCHRAHGNSLADPCPSRINRIF